MRARRQNDHRYQTLTFDYFSVLPFLGALCASVVNNLLRLHCFMVLSRRAPELAFAAGLASLPLSAMAHLLDGSPDPLPRWVPIAGLIIAGVMGGAVGFAISKHRQSMEQQKKQRLQRAAGATGSQAVDAPPDPRHDATK